jgi:hypothetical protein
VDSCSYCWRDTVVCIWYVLMAKKKPPKKGLPALLKKAHPALTVIDTLMRLSPSEEEFEGITERIAAENMDLVNKVLKIILPDRPHAGAGPLTDDTGLRQFAKEQIKKAPNPKGLRTVVDERGLPRLIYHATSSPDPFDEFHTKSRFKDDKGNQFATTRGFLSTGSDREQMQRWHPKTRPTKVLSVADIVDHNVEAMNAESGKEIYKEGARTIPGMVRAKNVFDHDNPEHIEMLRNSLIEQEVGVLKSWLEPKGPMAVTMEKLKEAYRHGDGVIRASQETLQEQLDHNIMMQDLMAKKARDNIDYMKQSNFLDDIRRGHWMAIEDKRRYLKGLGFDAFTTRESGQNIMLTDPAEQFVPLFDPEKKNPMGYTKGGKI